MLSFRLRLVLNPFIPALKRVVKIWSISIIFASSRVSHKYPERRWKMREDFQSGSCRFGCGLCELQPSFETRWNPKQYLNKVDRLLIMYLKFMGSIVVRISFSESCRARNSNDWDSFSLNVRIYNVEMQEAFSYCFYKPWKINFLII